MSIRYHKQTIIFLSIFTSLFLVSCKKEKPPVGKYYATFNYENSIKSSQIAYLEIMESNEDIIIINNSELLKCGKKIKGSFSALYHSDFTIDGKWTKKLFANSYKIKGSFISTTYFLGGPPLTESGNFIIESDFE